MDGLFRWVLSSTALGLLLASWLWWFLGARVSVYQIASSARLESSAFVHPVESPVGGRIKAVVRGLGESVREGEVLFEIDPEREQHQVLEANARLSTQQAGAEAVRKELLAERSLRAREIATAEQQIQEARAREREADVAARLARHEVERAIQLHANGLLSEVDLLRLQAEVERRDAGTQALTAVAQRAEAESEAQRTRSAARTAHLLHELTGILGEVAALEAKLAALTLEVDERFIRAPVAGRVGRLADTHVGSFVEQGDRLGEIVPEGSLRAVAFFPPSAVGRLLPGQPARLRLDAFPWTQFGILEGRVEEVATEAQEGQIRAQLSLRPRPGSDIRTQHGLVGTAEVEVERVAPALLALRAAGGWFKAPHEPHHDPL